MKTLVNDAVLVPYPPPKEHKIKRVIAITEDGRAVVSTPFHLEARVEPEPDSWTRVGHFERHWTALWKMTFKPLP